MQNGHFLCKSVVLSKKVSYKVSLCERRHQQSCKVFIGLCIHAKMDKKVMSFILYIFIIYYTEKSCKVSTLSDCTEQLSVQWLLSMR